MYLRTDFIKEVFPELFEEYGSKPFDIEVSLNHAKIKEQLPDIKPSGFKLVSELDSNEHGCLSLTLNLAVNILIDNEVVRSVYLSTEIDGALQVNPYPTKTFFKWRDDKVTLDFVGAEIRHAKVFDKEGQMVEKE